jgi:hypothetical protein
MTDKGARPVTWSETIASEIVAVRNEHNRADAKAAVLVTAAGIAASVLTAGPHGGLLGLLASATWAVSGAFALAVVMPRILVVRSTGFHSYATAEPGSLTRLLTPGHPSGQPEQAQATLLIGMSRLAVVKYRLLQISAGTMAVALTLTALAVALRHPGVAPPCR